MRSAVVTPEAAPDAGIDRDPDLVLAFLPPRDDQSDRLRAIAARYPGSKLVGCEAVTQFRNGALTRDGCLQLFWWEAGDPAIWVERMGPGEDPGEPADELTRRIEETGAAFLLADGLRCPAQDLLARIRRSSRAPLSHVAGGLASQSEPISGPGARVFLGEEILEGACLAVGLPGLRSDVRIVRGWDPASPVYEVTRAEGNVLHEIDREPATRWFERFFRLPDGMAPLPESAYRFPLILESPDPARQGLYRSMRFFDDPPGTVTFWGDLQEGDRVRLGIGNDLSLERAARGVGTDEAAEAAVLYSCVGREAVLGDRAESEVAGVRRRLGELPLAGFFTFGEIGPSAGGGLAFYNHTAVLALLREAGG